MARRFPHEISDGELQRVGLVRALLDRVADHVVDAGELNVVPESHPASRLRR